MKKYLIKETDEELEFGDIFDLTLTKDLEDGCVDRTIECTLTEDNVDFFLDMNIIEEKKDTTTINFVEDKGECPYYTELMEEIENLKSQFRVFSSVVSECKQLTDILVKRVNELIEDEEEEEKPQTRKKTRK